MPFIHQSVWSSRNNYLDLERTRVREEVKKRAVRDATAATDAVRAKLRRNLATTKANPGATSGPQHSSDGSS